MLGYSGVIAMIQECTDITGITLHMMPHGLTIIDNNTGLSKNRPMSGEDWTAFELTLKMYVNGLLTLYETLAHLYGKPALKY